MSRDVGRNALNLPTKTAATAGRATGNVLEVLGLGAADQAMVNRGIRFGWRLKRWAIPGVAVLSWLVWPTLTPEFKYRAGLPGGVAPPPEEAPEEE